MEDIEATGGIIGALKRRKPKRKNMKRMNMTGERPISLVTNLPWVIPLPNSLNQLVMDLLGIVVVIAIQGERLMIQRKPEF